MSSPEAILDAGRDDNATARHMALLSSPPYVQRTGHEQRARLVQQLHTGYGNHHVARVIARLKQGEESATRTAKVTPADASPPEKWVQQQTVAAAAGSGEGAVQRKEAEGGTAPTSPEADGAFQEVVSQSQEVAEQQKEHQPPEEKSQEAQDAAEPPANEVESKAQANQVDEMGDAPTPPFDPVAFKQALMDKIKEAAPKNLDEADQFKDSNKLESVKNDVTGKVDDAQKDSQGPLEEKTKATPDTSGITPEPVTPLPPNDPGQTPSDIGAQKAAPKSKGQSEVEAPAQARSQQLDQQLAGADITEEQLAKSNEPQFQSALDSKKTAQTHSETAPKAYRQGEQSQLSQAESTAAATAQEKLQGMHGERSQSLEQVTEKQVDGKVKNEQSRAKIAGDIDNIYQTTQTKVDDRLTQLTTDVESAFDAGAAEAKKVFEDYVGKQMDDYKDKRYTLRWDNPNGPAQWLIDKVLGMPDEVNRFYEAGRDLYIKYMDGVIDNVVAIVGTGLTEAKNDVADGRKQVKDYVAQLPEDLRATGEESATNIQSKFDGLEQDIQNKQDELIDTLAQKYKDNLDAVDASIQQMQEENKGLIQQAIDSVVGVIKQIGDIYNMLLKVLAQVPSVIEIILQDPIGFLGNLVNALGQGFLNFVKNILKYLPPGLLEWLTGALVGANIQMPTSLDLKGIIILVIQVLGVGYDAIRPKVVKRLGKGGEAKVSYLEKSFPMFQTLATQGVPGVWLVVKDDLGDDPKTMVLDAIFDFIKDRVIIAGITWIIGLLNPASAFFKACKAIYDIVVFFINRASQIVALVSATIDSAKAIAEGDRGTAITLVEGALAQTFPVAIGFLASLLGLGDPAKPVRGFIEKARAPVSKAIDRVIDQGVKFAKKIGGKIGGRGDKTGKDGKPDERTLAQKNNALKKAVADGEKILSQDGATPETVKAQLPQLLSKYELNSASLIADSDNTYTISVEINPKSKTKPSKKAKSKVPKYVSAIFDIGTKTATYRVSKKALKEKFVVDPNNKNLYLHIKNEFRRKYENANKVLGFGKKAYTKVSKKVKTASPQWINENWDKAKLGDMRINPKSKTINIRESLAIMNPPILPLLHTGGKHKGEPRANTDPAALLTPSQKENLLKQDVDEFIPRNQGGLTIIQDKTVSNQGALNAWVNSIAGSTDHALKLTLDKTKRHGQISKYEVEFESDED